MDQKNDYRTPRDRITGEFLSELFLENDNRMNSFSRGESRTVSSSQDSGKCGCARNSSNVRRTVGCDRVSTRHTDCRTDRDTGVTIEGNYSLAMVYIPSQEFEDLFSEEEGFCEGTIFKRLRFPFYPTPCRREAE